MPTRVRRSHACQRPTLSLGCPAHLMLPWGEFLQYALAILQLFWQFAPLPLFVGRTEQLMIQCHIHSLLNICVGNSYRCETTVFSRKVHFGTLYLPCGFPPLWNVELGRGNLIYQWRSSVSLPLNATLHLHKQEAVTRKIILMHLDYPWGYKCVFVVCNTHLHYSRLYQRHCWLTDSHVCGHHACTRGSLSHSLYRWHHYRIRFDSDSLCCQTRCLLHLCRSRWRGSVSQCSGSACGCYCH